MILYVLQPSDMIEIKQFTEEYKKWTTLQNFKQGWFSFFHRAG
jgi:hypothetical protein